MKKLFFPLCMVLMLMFALSIAPGAANPGNAIPVVHADPGHGDSALLEKTIIDGPPNPPPGYERERAPVAPPRPDRARGTNTLSVPAFDWSFGCSATSGAMIASYYDRTGFANMYTGPTNGGVMPMDSSVWPDWTDGNGDTYGQCPLTASHQGLDGRAIRGSIDDYWVAYGSSVQDPYISGAWTQHTWGDAIGDYMKTSQSAYSNTDGSTTFYTWTSSPAQLTCATMLTYGIHTLDGTYGRKLFYEAKGYTVTECYNQKTDNNGGGFTYAMYKAEIDAGRPVMLNLEGHTIVGVGYNDPSTVYIHDTWDYLTHSMTWGGSYGGMPLLSVSIVNLLPSEESTPTATSTATSSATPSPTATATSTHTVTATPSPTSSSTLTWTPTATATPSGTPTHTSTATLAPTETSTSTPTRTPTSTRTSPSTPTPTWTGTSTETSLPPTHTHTPIVTLSRTPTATVTRTLASSGTLTPTPSVTLTRTLTPTSTRTVTRTATRTATATATAENLHKIYLPLILKNPPGVRATRSGEGAPDWFERMAVRPLDQR